MRQILSASSMILAISFSACFCICDAASISPEEINDLTGRTDPKFKCTALCTNPVGVCTGNGTTCGNGNSGVHCGDYVITQKAWKQCTEDPAGGVDPCVNGTNDNCYTLKPCACAATLVGTTVVYVCTVPGGAKKQVGGAVVKSNDC